MATVLLHRIRSAASLGPSPTGEIVIDADAARTTVQLTTPDVREIVTALTRSDDLDVVYKQRDEARTKEDAGVKALTLAMQGIDRLTKERDAARADLETARKGVVEEQARADGLLKDVCALEIERDDLRAQVAQMTSGVPVAWACVNKYNGIFASFASEATADDFLTDYAGEKVPLFRATQPSPQVAELAAKVEALGIELAREKRMREETRKDLVAANDEVLALRARVATLLSGERLTKDALAAAEKNRDSWKERALLAEDAATKAIKDRAAAESDVRHLKDEIRRMEREASVGLSRLTDARRCAEAAESRLHDLETSAEPHSWAFDMKEGGTCHRTTEADARHDAAVWNQGPVFPLYRHPPKTGEPVAWDVVGDDGMAIACDDESHADKILDEHGGRKRALYEAPPPAAIGVTDEKCVVLEIDRLRTVNVKGPDHLIGSRAQAEERAKALHGTAYRLVQIDAPIVDIPAIRTVIADLRETFPTQTGEQSARLLLAAIGEKA